VKLAEGEMSKKEGRDKKAKQERTRRKTLSKLWLVGIVLGGSLLLGSIFFFGQGEPWGLPAIPRNPRPETLSPLLFTGQVARVYRIAQEVPELLERMPCYCGCYVNPGHRNNLDCYTDRHGAG
jgi:hypothetical protein